MRSIVEKIHTLIQKGFFHIMVSNVVNAALRFGLSVLVVKLLSEKEYGLYTYCWNIYSIILLFNGMGMESGTLQVASEMGNRQQTQKVMRYGVKKGILFDVLLLILIVGIGFCGKLKIEGAGFLMLSMGILPMFQFCYAMTLTNFQANKRNKEYAYTSLLYTIVNVLLSAAMILCFGTYGVVIGIYGACFVAIVLMRWMDKKEKKECDSCELKIDNKAIKRISLISMLNNSCSGIIGLLDIFVLGILDPNESILAGYKVATIIPTALLFVPNSVVTFAYPYFAEHREDHRWCQEFYKKVVGGLGCVCLLVSLVLFWGASFWVDLIFGENYLEIVPVFRMLIVNFFFASIFKVLSGNLIVTQRKLAFNTFVVVFSGMLSVALDYVLIVKYGSIGAAWATTIVTVVLGGIVTGYWLHLIYKKSSKNSEV